MNGRRALLTGIVLAAGGAAGLVALSTGNGSTGADVDLPQPRPRATHESSTKPAQTDDRASGATPSPRVADGGSASAPGRSVLLLPDGTTVPALNGALHPPPLQWRKPGPYAPIIGTATDATGVEWYVHADGSRSTTVMIYREDLGRMDAVTRVAHLGEAGPEARGR